jgi:hypothetical protein
MFANRPSEIGSGSGLFISESLIQTSTLKRSYLIVSASKLNTYSGEIKSIYLDYKLQEDVLNGDDDWKGLTTHTMGENTISDVLYEDNIHTDFSSGINPVSEEFKQFIPKDKIQSGEVNRVKFRLRFHDGISFVNDFHSSTNQLELVYPSCGEDDSCTFDGDEYMDWVGSSTNLGGSTVFSTPNKIIARTHNGQFSFRPVHISISRDNEAGQTYDDDGRLEGWGPAHSCETSQFGCEDPPTP